jgi:hypothetical protein
MKPGLGEAKSSVLKKWKSKEDACLKSEKNFEKHTITVSGEVHQSFIIRRKSMTSNYFKAFIAAFDILLSV